MSVDPTSIHLTPELQIAIAHYAELEGKQWEELLEDRFPLLEDPTPEELTASLAMCDQGMNDAKAGHGVEPKDTLGQIASRLGLNSEQ